MSDNINKHYWELEGVELELTVASGYRALHHSAEKRGLEFDLSLVDVRRLLEEEGDRRVHNT